MDNREWLRVRCGREVGVPDPGPHIERDPFADRYALRGGFMRELVIMEMHLLMEVHPRLQDGGESACRPSILPWWMASHPGEDFACASNAVSLAQRHEKTVIHVRRRIQTCLRLWPSLCNHQTCLRLWPSLCNHHCFVTFHALPSIFCLLPSAFHIPLSTFVLVLSTFPHTTIQVGNEVEGTR